MAMELLKQAEDYLKSLEKKIKDLEAEIQVKDETIRRLSVVSTAPKAVEAATATPAAVSAEAPVKGEEKEKVDWSKIQIVKVIHHKASPQEVNENIVYEDDAALGKPLPADEWNALQWYNGEKIEIGKGPIVVTFFSNLNKGDYVTLSVLSELQKDPRFATARFCAISRDADKEDVPKFLRKIQGNRFDELTSTDGSSGVTVVANYPLAYDAGDVLNKALKKTMIKGTVGVGMCIVIDNNGNICWYEKFVRGVNPMNQLESVLESVCKGEPHTIKNGKRPVVEEEEDEDLGGGDFPDDALVAPKKDGY